MATHFSILAWKIPRTEETGRLPSMGAHTVRHDRETEHPNSMAVLESHVKYTPTCGSR